MAPRARASLPPDEDSPEAKQSSPLLKFAGVGLLLTILFVALALFILPREDVRPASVPLADDASRVVAPPVAASHEPPTVTQEVSRPVAGQVAPEAVPEPALESDDPAERAAPERERERKAEKPAARRATRSSRGSKSVSCDPPYSIDAQGRRIFKVECM